MIKQRRVYGGAGQVGRLALVLFAILAPSFGIAGIPMYVQDWNVRLFDGSGVSYEPYVTSIIQDYASLYSEQQWNGGDAEYITNPDRILYWGCGHVAYTGVLSCIDLDNTIQNEEDIFYHSSDPSSLTARRTASGIELHWTWDLRSIDTRLLETGTVLSEMLGFVNEYQVYRGTSQTNTELLAIVTREIEGIEGLDQYVDSAADPNVEYYYEIKSVMNGDEVVDFTESPVAVPIGNDDHPHFWVDVEHLQETVYNTSSSSNQWEFIINASAELEENSTLLLEIYDDYNGIENPNQGPSESFDISSEIAGGRTEYTWTVPDLPGDSPDNLLKYFASAGGIFYRIVYVVDGQEFFYPKNAAVSVAGVDYVLKRFYSSAINNRTMGATWKEYLTNPASPEWRSACLTAANMLHDGSNGLGVHYDGIFFDTVDIMDAFAHNRVRPYELKQMAQYHTDVEDLVAGVLAGDAEGFEVYVNTTNIDLLEKPSMTGLAGAMMENAHDETWGYIMIGKALRRVGGLPGRHTIVASTLDLGHNHGDRMQLLAAYLLCRSHDPSADTQLFGYHSYLNSEFRRLPVIVPEQMLNVGVGIGPDLYAGVSQWPTAADYSTAAGMQQWFRGIDPTSEWIRNTSSGFFVVRNFVYNDGIGGDTILSVVWYLGGGPAPQVSFSELYGPNDDQSWYRLGFDEYVDGSLTGVMLTEGGRLTSTYENVGPDPSSFVGATMWVYASAPIASPELQSEPIVLSTTPHVQLDIAISASHWNGQPLDVFRVDGSSMGLDEEMEFTYSASDGLYHYIVPDSPGFDHGGVLPVMLKGTDGLMYFGKIEAQFESPVIPEITIGDRAVYGIPYTGGDMAVLAVEVAIGAVADSVAAMYVDASEIGGPARVEMVNDGSSGDLIAGDGVWSAELATLNPVPSVGEYFLPVVARNEAWDTIVESVQIQVIAPVVAKLCDESANTTDLQKIQGSPYSAVAFNYNTEVTSPGDWGHEDLVISQIAGIGKVFENQTSFSGAIEFSYRDGVFPGGTAPEERSRGLAVGDYNNDGYEDFFAAHESTPMLYQWDPVDHVFVQALEDFGDTPDTTVSTLSLLLHSSCAAWGDYNQDGWLDLVVGVEPWDYPVTAVGGGEVQAEASRGTGISFVFTNIEGVLTPDFVHGPFFGSVFSLSWLDFNQDGTLDLFVGDYFGTYTRVYYNQGGADHVFVTDEVNGAIACPPDMISGEFADLDNDGDYDLIAVGLDSSNSMRLYRTTPASSSGDFPELYEMSSAPLLNPLAKTGLNGSFTADLDLNGYLDIVALPLGSNFVPQVLLNGVGTSPAVFSHCRMFDSMEPGAIIGAVINDWNSDGDADLYLARAAADSAQHFFYETKNSATGENGLSNPAFIKVRLSRENMPNKAALGSSVEIFHDGTRVAPIQYVSGGDGRGAQRSRTLTFGLTEGSADSVTVKVTWPEGQVEYFAGQPTKSGSTIVQLVDTREPGIKQSSVAYSKSMGVGTVNWTFVWESNLLLSNPGVIFDPVYDPSHPCNCSNGGETYLLDGDPGVSVALDTSVKGTFRYTLTWSDQWCCSPNCTYRFKATGSIWDADYESDWVSVKTAKTCVTGL